MALGEMWSAPEGFVLVRDMLGPRTRRDFAYPRGWAGLSTDDACLLHSYLSRNRDRLREIHTDVECGLVPRYNRDVVDPRVEALAARLHPLRIDAIVRWSTGWEVLECKPDAGYVALGQLMCYGFYVPQCVAGLDRYTLGVVTDTCQWVVRPVFEAHGIRVHEVG